MFYYILNIKMTSRSLSNFRLGLHDIGLLFMPDRFPESDTKSTPENECLHEAWRQSSDTISCENNFITSTIFVVFFAYLPRNRLTSFALKPSIIKARFGSVSYRITMFICKTKRYGLYRIHFRTNC